MEKIVMASTINCLQMELQELAFDFWFLTVIGIIVIHYGFYFFTITI